MLDIDSEELTKKITHFINSYVKHSGTRGAVIGLSGGIDSSVTAYLTVRALGKDNVLGIIMPEKSLTPPDDVLDATQVAELLNIDYSVVEISPILESFLFSIPEVVEDHRLAAGNLKARIRMCILYYYANIMSRLVVGTGNRTEMLMGYFTKYGDGGVDIEPLGNLFKTQVRQLAQFLEVPAHIINKAPSAGLWAGQTDEEEMGITYHELDNILSALLDDCESIEYVVNRFGVEKPVITGLLNRIEKNHHKSINIPLGPK